MIDDIVVTQDFDEQESASACVECGAELWPETDRAFACGPNLYLCYACAERRGGVYDDDEDRWSAPPDVSGLPDERRPHP